MNRKKDRLKRQKLRKQTKAEKIVWEVLRDRRCGFKFRRQYSVKPYVLDFYCSELKLGLEIDGKIHEMPEAKEHDCFRDAYLRSLNIKVIRIKNSEVYADVHATLTAHGIVEKPTFPSPYEGEGNLELLAKGRGEVMDGDS